MIIAAGNEDAGFLDAGLFDQLKVLFIGPDPGGDLRERESRVLAQLQRLLVIGRIEEEFALADHAFRAAQAGHEFEQMQDLFRCKGTDRLLAVAEGRIGHPDFVRHLHGHVAHIERDLRYMGVIVELPVEVGLRHVLEGIVIVELHQQVVRLVKFQHMYGLLCPFSRRLRVISVR